MNNYISSLIIDPVLRQARRFSPTVARGTNVECPGGQSRSNSRSSYESNARSPSISIYGSSQYAFQDRMEVTQALSTVVDATDRGSMVESSASLPNSLHAHVHRHSDFGSSRVTNPRPSSGRTANRAYHFYRRSHSADEINDGRGQDSDRRRADEFRSRARGQSIRNAGYSSQINNHFPKRTKTAVKEDDGMRLLRRRIQAVHQTSLSVQQKAQRLHELMTEDYHSSQSSLSRAQSALSIRPHRCSSLHHSNNSSSQLSYSPSSPSSSHVDSSDSCNVTANDRQPSFWTPKEGNNNALVENTRDLEPFSSNELSFGCSHYKRNVKIQCFECHRWYPCRHCHDDNENHSLNRRRTQLMLCMLCGTPQPARQDCKQCGTCAAAYYCEICKLWDDDATKDIYHCDDCGICRRGKGLGTDFIHCKRCNVCLAISIADGHRCIERATECDCPICGEYLFTSSTSVAALPCGHYMHRMCYDEYINQAYKCPLCNKSAVNMELLWHELDQQAESQPMPPQFAQTSAVIFCNDCSSRSLVKFHWVGHKCAICGSYNTNDLQILDDCKIEETNTEEISPSSPVTSARSPTSLSARAFASSYVRSGSYFSQQEEQQNFTGLMANDDQHRFSPYEMLQRMSRSLSPIRQYLGGGFDRLDRAVQAFDDEEDGVDFWGADGHFLSGGEEEGNEVGDEWEDCGDDDHDDDDDEESEENTENEGLEEDEDDDGEDNLNGIELPGHL